MSRSRKKTPKVGNCADSDKDSKVQAHRAERRAIKAALDTGLDDSDLPHEFEFADPWNYNKDGKHIWDDPKGFRK